MNVMWYVCELSKTFPTLLNPMSKNLVMPAVHCTKLCGPQIKTRGQTYSSWNNCSKMFLYVQISNIQ